MDPALTEFGTMQGYFQHQGLRRIRGTRSAVIDVIAAADANQNAA
jgi:hypothetical protein